MEMENQNQDAGGTGFILADSAIDVTQNQNSSPTKGLRYQLYNPAHKDELHQLLKNAKRFILNGECQIDDDVDARHDNTLANLDGIEDSISIPLDSETTEDKVRLSCRTCKVTFDDIQQQRQHYRLDWHRYNLKRISHSQEPVSENEFNDMMEDLSSISGSDEEDDNPTTANLSRLLERVELKGDGSGKPGTSSSGKTAMGLGSPKVYFETQKSTEGQISSQIISVYKTLFFHKKDQSRLLSEDVNLLELLNNPLKIGVIMLSGGHFAACVFHGSEVLIHKTMHKYTVRAKQGGGQSSRDNRAGGAGIKSSGASLRRHNEAALAQNIQELLESWKPFLAECDLILYRISNSSQQILFGGKTPLFQKSNPKFRTIPLQTKRPTFSEAKRVLSWITTIEVYEKQVFLSNCSFKTKEAKILKTEESPSKTSTKKNSNIDRARSRSPKKHEEPQEVLSSPDEGSDSDLNVVYNIQQVDYEADFSSLKEFDDSLTREARQKGRQRRRNNKSKKEQSNQDSVTLSGIVGTLLDILNSKDGNMEMRFVETLEKESRAGSTFTEDLNQFIDIQNSTILHLAVKMNMPSVIWSLLEFGADPTFKDKLGKYPYNYAESKDGRNLFRKFRAQFPDKYDYIKAQIPSPLTADIEQELAEKKKLQNKLKREKEKLKKQEKLVKQNELDEQNRFLNLSDREKRALAAERRIVGQCKKYGEAQPVLLRCFDCGVDITGKVPFEYNQNQFCTPKCLAAHRKKFPCPLSL